MTDVQIRELTIGETEIVSGGFFWAVVASFLGSAIYDSIKNGDGFDRARELVNRMDP